MSEQREQYQATPVTNLAQHSTTRTDEEVARTIHRGLGFREQLPTGQEILDKLDDMIDEQQAHIKRFEGAPLTPIGATAIVHALLQLKEWIVLEPKPEANTEQAGQTDEQG